MILQVLRHSLEENLHQRIFLIDSLDAATLGLVAYFVCIFIYELGFLRQRDGLSVCT